ncbi:MAG TPA: ATP-binding protein [Egibacteraceae bacterium]|nr:ATP-binding protein [Egibacteraceae bacterium]
MRQSFPPDPASVPRARRFLTAALRAHGLPAWPAELLLSELVGNVLRHARTDFHVDIDVSERVRVEVRDGTAILPALQEARQDEERGRGLALVAALSDDWGVSATSSGKLVWFEVARDHLGAGAPP